MMRVSGLLYPIPFPTAQRIAAALIAVLALFAFAGAGPAGAQDGVESFDPDEIFADGAIDSDLTAPDTAPSEPVPVPPQAQGPAEVETSRAPGFDEEFAEYARGEDPAAANGDLPEWTRNVPPASGDPAVTNAPPADPGNDVASTQGPADAPGPAGDAATTYGEDDLIGAAEGVFGKGAEGLAGLIENLLEDQGRPNGYIVGREAGGALVIGARYGSGTLHHKVEGTRKVYWTGPSIGFDAGANAGNTFVLVYNLFDTEDLYKRFPAGEGQAYFVGGLTASYLRRGDIVLIPIRVGAGLRLGVNAGYMKFSKKQRWLPF
jgi:hypothetical protein